MSYEVTLNQFQGPIQRLLELIEGRELQITQISLAQVTEDFLKYVEELKAQQLELEGQGQISQDTIQAHLRLLADFVVVASSLVLIKSKSLLPELEFTPEEEKGIEELQERLRVYQQLKPLGKVFQNAWRQGNHQVSRPYLTQFSRAMIAGSSDAPIFLPGRLLTAAFLQGKVKVLFEALIKFEHEHETIREKVRSLEQHISHVIERVKGLGRTTLHSLVNVSDKADVVLTFLALLHLARDQSVVLEQNTAFSDIMIHHQIKEESA